MRKPFIGTNDTRPLLTIPILLDIVTRARSVISESAHADEHGELILELTEVSGLLEDASMTAGEILLPGKAGEEYWIRRRGYYWQGPVRRGYAVNPRDAYRIADREEAHRWALDLDATVEPALETR